MNILRRLPLSRLLLLCGLVRSEKVRQEVVRADSEGLLHVAAGRDARDRLAAVLDRICAHPSAGAA